MFAAAILIGLFSLATTPVGAPTIFETAKSEGDRIAELLQVGPGTVVADIGAGEGEWSIDLARRVGPTGKVYANEINPDDIEKIQEAIASSGLTNVVAVLGDSTSTGIESESCDALLLRVVYHHFSEPRAMNDEMWRILKRGGLLVVIDFPPRSLLSRHGAEAADVIEEIQSRGFQLRQRIDPWSGGDRRYCLLFQKP